MLEPSPAADVVAVATVPAHRLISQATRSPRHYRAWRRSSHGSPSRVLRFRRSWKTWLRCSAFPARGGRTRDRVRGRGYSDRSRGGAVRVATVDDAGLSRGLNQSERMERRGEPEPLSRAIVDQGFENRSLRDQSRCFRAMAERPARGTQERRRDGKGNFPPRKALKVTKRRKNLVFARARSAGGGTLRAEAKARCGSAPLTVRVFST